MKVVMVLVMITDGQRLLLGMKKRGFGAGRWNGFGGKVEAGESLEVTALRECQEEAGITPFDLRKRGLLLFHFENDPLEPEVHVYSASTFDGDPVETDEMLPQWFPADGIPYDAMWLDDRHWLPVFLSGKNFIGTFHFRDQQTLLSADVVETNP